MPFISGINENDIACIWVGWRKDELFKKAWRDGMTDADFVRAAYDERATRFGSAAPEVRASVQRRLRREADDILGGLSGAGGVNGMSLQAAMQLEGAIDRERARVSR